MKRIGAEDNRSLWYLFLTAALPVFACALSAAFVALCFVYSRVRPFVTIELGEESPDVEAFLCGEYADAAFIAAPKVRYRAAGAYPLRVFANGRSVLTYLRVTDTQAPRAEGTETTVALGQVLTPDKLIKNLRDESVVRVAYASAPDFDAIGDYETVVVLEDASKNRTRVPVTVHVRTVRDEVVIEAGEPVPAADAFLIGTYGTGDMEPIDPAVSREPGEYPVRITADGIEAQSRLVVRDTVPPNARGITCVAAPGEPVTADMLVTDLTDETDVAAVFAGEPDPQSLEPQTVEVLLTDRGGNETRVHATLLFSSVKPVGIEARRTPMAVSELLEDGSYTEASMDVTFIPSEPGLHVLAVAIDGVRNLALVDVRDTTPPELAPSKEAHYLNTPVEAGALVTVSDMSETTCSFLSEPDWSKDTQDVSIAAVDAFGNGSELTFSLTLVPDVEPPLLYGVHDRYCYRDEPVAYFFEVSAWDACDGAVEVAVDASQVDISHIGGYYVTYSATDKAGNTATKRVIFNVVPPTVDDARAQEVAEQILEKILTDGMTLPEQVEAIYNYVFYHVRYSSHSNKQDWRSEAVRGLTKGRGDCFTAYAAARLLLEHTDAQLYSVQRSGPNTHHYWLLVNAGTGWYHFDACRAWTGKKRCFMWTDAQTRRVSKTYWQYDKTLYPPVATEPYNGGN